MISLNKEKNNQVEHPGKKYLTSFTGLSHLFDGEHSRLAEAVASRGTALSCLQVRKHGGWKLREANGVLFPLTLPSDIKMGAEEKENGGFQGAAHLCPPSTEAQPGAAGVMRLCQAPRLLPDFRKVPFFHVFLCVAFLHLLIRIQSSLCL